MYLLIDARGTESLVDNLTLDQLEECRRRGVIVLESGKSCCGPDGDGSCDCSDAVFFGPSA